MGCCFLGAFAFGLACLYLICVFSVFDFGFSGLLDCGQYMLLLLMCDLWL